jgi:hypothetical protein
LSEKRAIERAMMSHAVLTPGAGERSSGFV